MATAASTASIARPDHRSSNCTTATATANAMAVMAASIAARRMIGAWPIVVVPLIVDPDRGRQAGSEGNRDTRVRDIAFRLGTARRGP
ncbi:hypothetical protein GCM10022282_30610 [Agromyces indicus]